MDGDENKLVSGEAHRRSVSQSPLEQTINNVVTKFEANAIGSVGDWDRNNSRSDSLVTYGMANGIDNIERKSNKSMSPEKHNSKNRNKKDRRESDISNTIDDDEGLTNHAIELPIDDDGVVDNFTNKENEINKVEVFYRYVYI